MADEKWEAIFARKPMLVLPGAPSRILVLPPEGPSCPEHCSGRHEHDAWLACRMCGGRAYRVILHEYKHQPGHYFNVIEPVNGSPEYVPQRTPTCCNEVMVRVAK